MKKVFRLLAILSLFWPAIGMAQAPAKHNAAEIQQMLRKLNVLGSVMYVAAHPDDENTQMIAYFANETSFRTVYFSATRGDGGQNLIGVEIRELLGIIRTQELLAARRIDGGEQIFSRANDFGFSKHPDETFNIWDKEQVLADLVWAIRTYRPDIIITRFSLEPGITHGHHTASAMLANEAFDISNDPKAFPEQLKYVKPWQPERIFWNTSWWFYRNTGRKMDTTGLVPVDIGKYNPLLGKSYSEISALSRSMHKSQGFGATGRRGTEVEYLKQWKGSEAGKDPFNGINTTWSRVKNGDKVAAFIQKALVNYDPMNPSAIVPELLGALKALENIDDDYWKSIKRGELQAAIKACMGLFLEAKSLVATLVPGDSLRLTLEAVNRSGTEANLKILKFNGLQGASIELGQPLTNNSLFNLDYAIKIPESLPISHPYWLVDEGSDGMYKVTDQLKRGQPENKPAITATFTVTVQGTSLDYEVPVIFKKNDPVEGEVYEPLVVAPPVMMNITDKVYVMANGSPKQVTVKVIGGRDNLSGKLALELPKGWKTNPASLDVTLARKGDEKEVSFEVIPSKGQSEGVALAVFTTEGKKYDMGISTISYGHIPKQTLFPKATARVVNLDLATNGKNIGYIMGAGDEIPASLRQIGYNVWEMKDDEITEANLAKIDALILGVRALNTVPRLKVHMPKLFNFVENGGTMIVQYNTTGDLVTDEVAPYPLRISRDRVAVEDAPVTILAPDHPAMNVPNKITKADFDGWVQERGLYFPDQWGEQFVPILSTNDPGEDPKQGGLLVAKHGKGYYVYTGYSWFRELPAGVPGAYRLFSNLISLGQAAKSNDNPNTNGRR